MSNTFFIADTHFGHKGVTQFLKADGTKLRPWDTVEEMDEALVERWNKKVRPKDKVYVVGDVAINNRHIETIGRCNGDKVLYKGNHDIFRLVKYTPFFRDIRAFGAFDGYLIAHIPVHPSSLARWNGQIHGHLHSNVVMGETVEYNNVTDCLDTFEMQDRRYVSVCVEQPYMDFAPIAWEDLKQRFF